MSKHNIMKTKKLHFKFFRMNYFNWFLFSIFMLLILSLHEVQAASTTQTFGTGTGTYNSSTGSASFIPALTNTVNFAVAGDGASSLISLLSGTNPLGSTDTYMQAVAGGSTFSKVIPIASYTSGGDGTAHAKFKVLFGGSTSSSTASSGNWSFYLGSSGTMYTGTGDAANGQIIAGIRFTYGVSGALSLTYRTSSSTWVTTNLASTAFNQGVVYTIELIGNNTVNTINYGYANGSTSGKSVATGTWDLYIDGVLIGSNLTKSGSLTPVSPTPVKLQACAFIGTGSTGNVANIYIDDVYFNTAAISATITGSTPTLVANTSTNNVDNNFDITFPDNSTWRTAISAVKIGGTALTATTDYVIAAGKITLKPSGGNSLLRTSGIKTITVEAANYTTATVTQVINAGAAAKLAVKTQPSAPAYNGGALATQPAVYIQDQYGNTANSSATVTATATSSLWTPGGSTTAVASAGTATFAGLTASYGSAVSGATITFTSGSLTSVISNGFDIPAPVSASITVGTITAFGNQAINSTSAEKSYTVSGSGITSDIIITPPSGYEISLTSASGTGFVAASSINLTPDGANSVASTTIYVHFKPTATQSYSGNITHTNTVAPTQNVAVSGTGIYPEPTNHATSVSATATVAHQITVTWADATGGQVPTGYLVKAVANPSTPTAPSDGTPEADAAMVKNIVAGVQTVTFSGLISSTQYNFEVWPYTNSGSIIDYKTDGTVPTTSVSTVVGSYASDYYRSLASGNWNSTGTWESSSDNSNWITATLVPDNTANAITILNGHTVTLTSSVTADQLTINTGGQITINSGNTLTMNDGTSTDLNIQGTLLNSGNLIFTGGSSTTVDGTLNNSGVLTLNSGATTLLVNGTFNQNGGTAITNNSTATPAITFSSGSTYKHNVNVAVLVPAGSWSPTSTVEITGFTTQGTFSTFSPTTTYGNVTWNCTGQVSGFVNVGGTLRLIGGNLKVLSTGAGSFRLTSSSNITISITGNLEIQNGTVEHSVNDVTNCVLNIGGNWNQTGGTFTSTFVNNTLPINFTGTNSTFIHSSGTLSNTYINWTVNAGKSLTLTNDLPVASGRTLTVNGTLDCGSSSVVSGAGAFTLASASTLKTANVAGVDGSITVSGIKTWNAAANYVLNGTEAQVTGASLTAANTLEINNAAGVSLSGNTTVATLSIDASAVCNVPAAKQLTVSTALTNNGVLNLRSTQAEGSATLLTSGTVSNGTYNVEQYLNGARNWYVSSPLSNALVPSGNTYFNYVEPGNNSDLTQSGSSAYWKPVYEGNSFVAGVGYIAKPTGAGLITFSTTTGKINTGDVLINLTKVGGTKTGFNLCGNPFPAHLTFTEAMATAANAIESVWYRTATYDDINSKYVYSFNTFNVLGGPSVSVPVGTTGVIPPMQAFWLRANTANADVSSLTLNNSMCTANVSSNPLKSPAEKAAIQQVLRIQLSTGTNNDEAVLYSNLNASNNYDGYDSPKMFNNSASIAEIYSIAGAENVAINGLNSIPFDTEIPLGFSTLAAGNFSMKASQISNFASGTQIILKDNMLDAQQDLTVADYSFTSDATTNNTSRFSLIFHAPSVATGINQNSSANVWISLANNQIVVNGASAGTTVAVNNEVGQRLTSQTLTATTKVLNTKLASGVYMVTVTNAGKSTTTKIIIK